VEDAVDKYSFYQVTKYYVSPG